MANPTDYAPSKLLFKIEDPTFQTQLFNGNTITNNEQFNQLITDFQITHVELAFPKTRIDFLRNAYFMHCDGCVLDDLITSLQSLEFTSYVEKIPLVTPFYTPNDYTSACTMSNLWHLDKINAENAWDLTKGDPSIKIAIIDYYLDMDHPDFVNTDGSNQVDFYFDMGTDAFKLTSEINPSTNSLFPAPGGGGYHGTWVSGFAAGSTDNGEFNSSIGFKTKLRFYNMGSGHMPVKNLNTDLILGLRAVEKAAIDGNDIINMSWGWFGATSYGTQTIAAAQAYGSLVVNASGQGSPITKIGYPSSAPDVFAITMTDAADLLPNNALIGSHIDFSAPGVNVESMSYDDGCSGSITGTSFSAPITCGVMALILSINPCLDRDEVYDILKNTAVNLYALNSTIPAGHMGHGNIDAEAALNYTIANHPFNTNLVNNDIIINSNVIWSANNTINSLITVTNGGTLEINNGAKIEFTDSRKMNKRVGIVVKPGGKLIIDNAELTVFDCERHHLWDGIVVYGEEQNFPYQLVKGKVEVKNNAIISNAVVGIKSGGSTSWYYDSKISDGYYTSPMTSIPYAKGDIEADNSSFVNNYISIMFNSHVNSPTASSIDNCLFLMDEKIKLKEGVMDNYYDPLDPYFYKSVGGNHQIIGVRAETDPDNPGPGTGVPNVSYKNNVEGSFYAFIVSNNTNEIPINSCEFNNSIYSQFSKASLWGNGIVSNNSSISVDGINNVNSEFKNLYYGIDNYNTPTTVEHLKVKNTNFNNVSKNITINGGFGHRIAENNFLTIPVGDVIAPASTHPISPSHAVYDKNWGIYASSTNNCLINDNVFEAVSLASQNLNITNNSIYSYSPAVYGVIYNNAGRYGAAANYLKNNTFEKIDVNLQTEEFNHYLDVWCNDHSNSFQAWVVAPDPWLDGSNLNDRLKNQGSSCADGKTNDNYFQFSCNQSEFDRHIFTNITFDYYGWGAPPTTVPNCSGMNLGLTPCGKNTAPRVSVCDKNGWGGQGLVTDVLGSNDIGQILDGNNSGSNADEIAIIINDHDATTIAEKMLVATIVSENWINDYSTDDLIQFYENINFENVDELLITFYFANGDLGKALTLIQNLPIDTEANIKLKQLLLTIHTLSSENRYYWPNSGELDELFALAKLNYHASNLARTYLSQLFNAGYYYQPQKVVDLSTDNKRKEDEELENQLSIYPNPASDLIYIKGLNIKIVKVEVMDLTGKIIKSMVPENTQMAEVDVSQLSTGLYIVRVNNSKTQKIVVE